jgi:hypothetical protein
VVDLPILAIFDVVVIWPALLEIISPNRNCTLISNISNGVNFMVTTIPYNICELSAFICVPFGGYGIMNFRISGLILSI